MSLPVESGTWQRLTEDSGRAFAVLPRKLNEDGYIDLGDDDYVDGSVLANLQRVVLGA